jgi:hypothetical protein
MGTPGPGRSSARRVAGAIADRNQTPRLRAFFFQADGEVVFAAFEFAAQPKSFSPAAARKSAPANRQRC